MNVNSNRVFEGWKETWSRHLGVAKRAEVPRTMATGQVYGRVRSVEDIERPV